jgi:hypothetical protein
MRRPLASFILCAGLLAIPAQPKHSGSGSHSKSSGASSESSKPIHVREYTRKDGTVVHAHDRVAPGETHVKAESSQPSRLTASEPSQAPPSLPRDEYGRIKRSESAKHDFERAHPCPSNGKTSGGCSGYIVDHVRPLACGEVDAPANMQWQTIAQAKEKDAWERKNCN